MPYFSNKFHFWRLHWIVLWKRQMCFEETSFTANTMQQTMSNISCFITGRQCSCKPCTSYDRDVCLSVCLSVRPSVRPSHAGTEWKRRKLGSRNLHRRIAQWLFGIKNSSRNSKGFTPSEGVKWEWGRKNSQFSANKSPYLRNSAR